jgi:hypothetical protein
MACSNSTPLRGASSSCPTKAARARSSSTPPGKSGRLATTSSDWNRTRTACCARSQLTRLPAGASHLGHFLVAPAASAVPEPSTYALLAGLAALGGVFIRRIKRARAPQT